MQPGINEGALLKFAKPPSRLIILLTQKFTQTLRWRLIHRAIYQGYLIEVDADDHWCYYRLTSEGEERLRHIQQRKTPERTHHAVTV